MNDALTLIYNPYYLFLSLDNSTQELVFQALHGHSEVNDGRSGTNLQTSKQFCVISNMYMYITWFCMFSADFPEPNIFVWIPNHFAQI